MNIIIRGPLGVGKTTTAKKIAEYLDATYVSVDDILEKNRLDKIDKKLGKIPLKNFLIVNKTISEISGDLVIEGNFYYQEQIDDLVSKIGPPIIFNLKADINACIKRDKSRKNCLGEKAAMRVHGLVSEFERGTNIDTNNKTPEEVAKLVLRRLIKQ